MRKALNSTPNSNQMETSLPPPQPQLPKESVVQRYKFVWRLLLISNLALGAYMFASARKKDTNTQDSKAAAKVSSARIVTTTSPTPEEPVLSPPITEPLKVVRQPIPEDQQHELLKWILEEKRKVKPKDPQEKKQIDKEKAILKQFIRSKYIPSL